jgi:hypothetical protein
MRAVRTVLAGLLSLSALASLPAGCKGKTPPSAPKSCQKDTDCPDPLICLAGACADPRESAIYTNPSQAVTPQKVKQQVEQTNQQIEDKLDKIQGTQ